MIMRWGARRTTAVLGLPGDRTDELLQEASRAAAGYFDSIVIREDGDLRGRRRGEVPELIRRTIAEYAPHVELRTITNEIEALAEAVTRISPGDAVVCFSEHQHDCAEWLQKAGAQLCADPEKIREIAANGVRISA